jgi:hypothetical protein
LQGFKYVCPTLRARGKPVSRTSEECPSTVSDNILAALLSQKFCLLNNAGGDLAFPAISFVGSRQVQENVVNIHKKQFLNCHH